MELWRPRYPDSEKYPGAQPVAGTRGKLPGRDHLVRIRQLDCNCTVTDLHHQSGGTLQELRQRRRTQTGLVPRWRLQHLRFG